MAKAAPKSAERNGIYKVTSADNTMIAAHDDFKERLTDDDWIIALGQGEYLVLQVMGDRVKGLANYRFHGKLMGTMIRWKPTNQEVGLLIAGQTITAPMALDSHLPDRVIVREGRWSRATGEVPSLSPPPDVPHVE